MKFNKNKKAMTLFSDWAEIFFLILLGFGFALGIASQSAVITYLIGFFSGMMAGRLLYERKHKMSFPYLLIIIGFGMGYVIGTFYGNRLITLSLFIIGNIISYKLFDKGVIRDTSF